MSMTFFLCFCRSICIINIKKFSKNFQIILKVNEEVDNFKWFTFDEARANIKKNSLAERFLVHYLDHLVK